jgi:hypothetical protein
MCLRKSAKAYNASFDQVNCSTCRGALIQNQLVRAPTTIDNWDSLLAAVREMNESGAFNIQVVWDRIGSGFVSCKFSDDDPGHTITRFPKSIQEKAHKLLAALVRRSNRFGARIDLKGHMDYPLAYASDADELNSFVEYLAELDLIRVNGAATLEGDSNVFVTAEGYEANEAARLLEPLTIFICSTCYDLKDVRAELADHFEQQGFRVLLSDDSLRFEISVTSDSIESCLLNVGKADVVVCVVDQRYGPVLPDGPFAGISATHAEVRFAKAKGIPVLHFIRREAFHEYSMLKRDATVKTTWVETSSEERRHLWVSFVAEFATLPTEGGVSNWVDPFTTIVDLKEVVLLRIRTLQRAQGP